MATIRLQTHVQTTPEAAWAAIADIGAIHQRLARGFVTDTALEGGDRLVTFGNGVVARERIISLEPEARRLAYAVVENPALTHHSASIQVLAESDDACSILWTADVLPDTAAERIGGMMQAGSAAMRQTLEAA